MTEQKGREAFFSKVFYIYQCVMFSCAAGIIWLCQPLMRIFRENFFTAWQFVPVLTMATVFSCFNQFLNSIYMVEKRSTLALYTMLTGAVTNCVLNYFFILRWGSMGATYASLISYMVVFILRCINTRGLLRVEFYPLRILINLALLILETVVILGQGKYWVPIVTVLTAAVCLFNVRGTVGMALHLFQKVRKRRAA